MNKGMNHPEIRDYGAEPFVFNMNHAARMNENFRLALWTGQNMQLTLMNIPQGEDIGAEMHPDLDQFLFVERGRARVYIGNRKDALREAGIAGEGYVIIIPAGAWHNIVNAGPRALKLCSVYAPKAHPYGTVHRTKADAEREEY